MAKARKLKPTDKPSGHTFGKLNLKGIVVKDNAVCEGEYSDDWADDEHPLVTGKTERTPHGPKD